MSLMQQSEAKGRPPGTKSRPQTSFFTQGQRHEHNNSYIIINQSYVQYIRPHCESSQIDDVLPILFIHGGGLTGARWEATPDRRPRWAMLASEAGHPCYVLDAVDSGRSQAAPAYVREHSDIEHRTCEQVWTRFRFGSAADFESRRPFEGSQVVVEVLDSLVGAQAARRRTTDHVGMQGIIEAINEIGMCIVVAHSHGAALVMDALTEIKQFVAQLVLVEPGETAVAARLLDDVPTLLVWGDYLDKHAVWTKIIDSYKKAPVEVLMLTECGLVGNPHFPMLDRNSDQVYAKIHQWLSKP